MITEEPVGPTETLTIDQGLAAYLRASRRSSKVPSGNAAEKQRGATYAILLTQSRCLRERGLEPLPNQVSRAIDSDKAEVSGSSPLRPTRFPWSEAVSGRGGLVVAPRGTATAVAGSRRGRVTYGMPPHTVEKGDGYFNGLGRSEP